MYELWRDIVSFRKQFTELKGTTERDLIRVKNDLAQTGRSLTSACFGYLTNAKAAENQDLVSENKTLLFILSLLFYRLQLNENVVIERI
jgi:hypothetical protein